MFFGLLVGSNRSLVSPSKENPRAGKDGGRRSFRPHHLLHLHWERGADGRPHAHWDLDNPGRHH